MSNKFEMNEQLIQIELVTLYIKDIRSLHQRYTLLASKI